MHVYTVRSSHMYTFLVGHSAFYMRSTVCTVGHTNLQCITLFLVILSFGMG